MGYGHSLDLRRRIIAAARRFDVSPSSAIKLVQRWHRTGSYAPGQIGGQRKRRLWGYEDWLHDVMATTPDITLSELQSRLAENGVEISMQAINTTLHARMAWKMQIMSPPSESCRILPDEIFGTDSRQDE